MPWASAAVNPVFTAARRSWNRLGSRNRATAGLVRGTLHHMPGGTPEDERRAELRRRRRDLAFAVAGALLAFVAVGFFLTLGAPDLDAPPGPFVRAHALGPTCRAGGEAAVLARGAGPTAGTPDDTGDDGSPPAGEVWLEVAVASRDSYVEVAELVVTADERDPATPSSGYHACSTASPTVPGLLATDSSITEAIDVPRSPARVSYREPPLPLFVAPGGERTVVVRLRPSEALRESGLYILRIFLHGYESVSETPGTEDELRTPLGTDSVLLFVPEG